MTDLSILLGLTGLNIDGGIASVSRCVVRAIDERAVAGAIRRADRVLLLDEPDDAPSDPPRGVQKIAAGSQPRFAWHWLRTYLRHRHDIAFFDLVGLARVTQLPAPWLPPKRVVIFAHGIELTAAHEGARARALHSAWRILANSEFTARTLRDMHPELAERIFVVPLCISPERTQSWEAATESAAPPREPVALIVGRMWPDERGKGHDELIAAWPTVRRAVPDAQLWIVGGGADVPRLEQLARDHGAEGVKFWGRVADTELADLYRRASLYAMPSRQEGFGLAYAEAMWFGTPCLGSTADAAAQVIRDGETGRLVPYGDVAAIGAATAEILSNPIRAREMGERAQREAHERFTYPRFRDDLLRALEISA
jgi:phosphatidylinositol alpha-1,6-mannosyltransferase